MPPTVGSSTGSAFLFDLGSPESYLAAERALKEHPGAEWIPILAAGLPGGGGVGVFRCAEEEASYREDVERAVRDAGLQELRWPQPWPFDATRAMVAATYAKQIGRAVAFSLAAFRQAFAGGRSLADDDTILIAAAACEMHPNAVLKALERDAIAAELRRATAMAADAGVRAVPAVVERP